MTIQLKRTHTGDVTLFVNGNPASAAKFSGIQQTPEGMAAVFVVPLANAAFAEVDNVVPFRSREPIRSDWMDAGVSPLVDR